MLFFLLGREQQQQQQNNDLGIKIVIIICFSKTEKYLKKKIFF